MKKKALAIILVIAIYLGFLTLSIVLGSQQGLYFQGNFWHFTGDGVYKSSVGEWIRRSGYDSFELHFGGKSITAQQSDLPDGGIRMDFSDGWTVEWDAEDDYWFGFDDYIWGSDARLILTDMAAQDFRFAAAASEERSLIYDQDGNAVAESVLILSAEGELLDYYEIWEEKPQYNTPERQLIVLKNGTDISGSEAVYLNESGEYLLDSHTLGKIATATSGGYSSIDRRGLTHFLVRIGSGAIERRSETMDMQIFLSVLLYAAGALQLFLPQELAFFGSRWLFRNEPELSDSGRAAMLIGGGVVMVFAIIILFIGL